MQHNPGDPGCTCYRLRQAARLASRLYDQSLAPLGINIGQFGVLSTLSAMNVVSVTQIARVLQMDRTTLTRNLRPLQRRGYVVMSAASDARSRSLSLTELGRQILKSAKPRWKEAQRTVTKSLGRERTKMLHAVLEDSIDRIQQAAKSSSTERNQGK